MVKKPEPEPEPEAEPEPEPPRRGRPKKEPGAPKAKYERKPKVLQPPQPPPQPSQPSQPSQPIDEEAVARHVVANIGRASRDHFEARRNDWRALVARNYQ